MTRAKSRKEKIYVTANFEKSLYDAMVAEAKKHCRSLAGQVRFLCVSGVNTINETAIKQSDVPKK